ncbi:MAG TPA: hypothetical protein VGZ29_08445 [Terriglobia bacterium]|nr:hypothetical protein [Terriglobia bacterium]
MVTTRSILQIKTLVVALFVVLAAAGLASAQTAQGSFTLPFEAQWGASTLPSGDYSFTLDKAQSAGLLHLFRGKDGVALIHSQSYSLESSGRSALTVVRSPSGNTVRDLSLPEIGVVLHYAPHKPGRGSAAAEREMAQKIPIITSGK